MRQSACLDCLHITHHLDQHFCPACQSTNMTSNKYQVVLVHAKRIEQNYEAGSKEFREQRFESLKALAEQADLMIDRRRKHLRDIPFSEYFKCPEAAAKAENWRQVNASAN